METKVDYGPIQEDKTKGEIRSVACQECNRTTRHVVLSSIFRYWNLRVDEGISGMECNEIIQCQGCENFSFRATHGCSEDMDENGDYPETELLYPQRISGRKKLDYDFSLPSIIRYVYEETHTALCSSLNILAAAGIRILIENVCIDQKATGHELEKKIDSLVEMGILSKRNAEILHKTRVMGNHAVHNSFIPSKENLDTAMDIAEGLLRNVYILPNKAQSLK